MLKANLKKEEDATWSHEYVNMFMVLNELKEGLTNSSLFTNKEQVGRYMTCIDLVVKKLTEILKNEVQRALVGDEDAIIRLCTNYIDNVMAYINKSKMKDPITGQDRKPDERLMRSIEEKISIPEQGSDDFRRQIAAFIGSLANDGKKFKYDSNPQLKKALEAKLFEDVKDTIKLSTLNVSGTNVVDVYVNYLRKKLMQFGGQRLIHTVIGMGYVMREEE